MDDVERWVFGEEPLSETVALATAVRELVSCALALEEPDAEVRRVTAELVAARERLERATPTDMRPRVGDAPDDGQRVYLDHSRDIGDYNPCFPTYRLTCADDRAKGEIEFPVLYEGPPGIVHGGFLAVVFDCVLQQLNCDLGLAGKTAGIEVRYRRPTPLLTPLQIEARRELRGDRIWSEAQLLRDGKVLCEAEMSAVAGRRDSLPAVSPRRNVR